MIGHTNCFIQNIEYYSVLIHKIHNRRGIELCMILFHNRLTFSTNKGSLKPNPLVCKIVIYAKYIYLRLLLHVIFAPVNICNSRERKYNKIGRQRKRQILQIYIQRCIRSGKFSPSYQKRRRLLLYQPGGGTLKDLFHHHGHPDRRID